MENHISSQCEHVFELDPNLGEVRCIKCRAFDDEMQLPVPDAEARDARDKENEAQESQLNFE
jgi:hypothetical protein